MLNVGNAERAELEYNARQVRPLNLRCLVWLEVRVRAVRIEPIALTGLSSTCSALSLLCLCLAYFTFLELFQTRFRVVTKYAYCYLYMQWSLQAFFGAMSTNSGGGSPSARSWGPSPSMLIFNENFAFFPKIFYNFEFLENIWPKILIK